jgi:hypothetical protein
MIIKQVLLKSNDKIVMLNSFSASHVTLKQVQSDMKINPNPAVKKNCYSY